MDETTRRATPRPWTANDVEPFEGLVSGIVISSGEGEDFPVAIVLDGEEGDEPTTVANANLIARAVNNHQALTDAVGGAVDEFAARLKEQRGDEIEFSRNELTNWLGELRAVLAKAEAPVTAPGAETGPVVTAKPAGPAVVARSEVP